MGIKRNKLAEPQWNFLDYAEISKEDLFSAERWGKTADWHIILNQVEKTRKASQMIDIKIYPSSLFLSAIDLLEANLLMVDDLFYYLTGVRIPWNKQEWEEARKRLVFWNMDCYEVLKKIRNGLLQIKDNLTLCLKQEPIWDISLKVGKIRKATALALGPSPVIPPLDHEWHAYEYAHKYYEGSEIDQEALATQIKRILDILQEYAVIFLYIYNEFPDFSNLLALFCQSEKAQTEYIEPWRHDFDGTRDSLIAKMEKDPKLGPWVNRFVHLPKVEKIHYQLFYNAKNLYMPENEEECYNTENWISILTIAAVLQEYDEQHAQPAKKPAMKAKAPSPFTDFIIDTPRSEAVLKRLHEIIDGKKPKVCALTILAAAQSGILMQPTYRAVFSEFPEIGDRKNYEYYLQRKDNYSDDIDSIAKGF